MERWKTETGVSLSSKSSPHIRRPELLFQLHADIDDPGSYLFPSSKWFLHLQRSGPSSSKWAKKGSKDKKACPLFQSVFMKNSHNILLPFQWPDLRHIPNQWTRNGRNVSFRMETLPSSIYQRFY